MKNYLWNMFSNIKNGQSCKVRLVHQKRKIICEEFLKVLWKEGFILGYKIDTEDPSLIIVFLKYCQNKPVINNMRVISKPSRRIWYSSRQICKIDSSKVFIVFSTNRGLKTLLDCKKLKIGGEPFISLN